MEHPPTVNRLAALLGMVLTGALALFPASMAYFAYFLYRWDECSYDLWNAIITGVWLCAAASLATACFACLLYAADRLRGRRVLPRAMIAGVAFICVGWALLNINPPGSEGRPYADCHAGVG